VGKNLRLIVRTPMMMVQCVAQALIPIGIACVLGSQDVARGIAFFVIFAAGILAGMFTIAAGTVEECDDLLVMSPHGAGLFRFGKMVSGFLWPLGAALPAGVGLFLAGEPLLAGPFFSPASRSDWPRAWRGKRLPRRSSRAPGRNCSPIRS